MPNAMQEEFEALDRSCRAYLRARRIQRRDYLRQLKGMGFWRRLWWELT